MRFRYTLVVVALLALFPLSAVSTASKKTGSPKVVASGLDNPRGLDVRHGVVYVAEAGRGGDGPCVGSEEEGGIVCVGASGAVTKAWHGKQRRILSGLPSIAAQGTGADATGPQDFELGRFGGAWFVVGLGADPAARETIGPLGPRFGKLYFVSPFGRVRAAADIAGFEGKKNPDGGVPDSNPNSVADLGFSRVVADAGGNDLVRVGLNGRISTLAVFPNRIVDAPPFPDLPDQIPMEAVPTSVVEGPDGALYVGQLTGFPFPVGGANVFRVKHGRTSVYASGFTNIIDIAFDKRGNLYVLEIATNGLLSGDPTGALIKVRRNGTRETIASEELEAPGGLAIDRDGDIYVSNKGTSAGGGEVLRFAGR